MKEADRVAIVESAKRKLSRKGFLFGSAGVLGAGALLGAQGIASAHETEEGVDDELILNYALTLEHLESMFYMQGLRKFSSVLPNQTRRNLQQIRNHEARHVNVLMSVIDQLGGTPVPKLVYNFNETAYNSRAQFLSVAQLLENTGVAAYNGAIAHINGAAYLTAGAQIATIEARHASYLNGLNGDSPFPKALDDATPAQDIATVVRDSFVKSNPEAGPYGPYDSFNDFLDQLPDTIQPDNSGTNQNAEVNRIVEEAAE